MQLLRLELYRIFQRPRTYISFGTITIITLLMQVALYSNGKEFLDFLLQGLGESFVLEGNILNGYLITYIILLSLLVHVPLLIALVAGDAIAGEAAQGTLRLLLTKPVSRIKLLLVKFSASVIYSLLLLVWLALMSLGLSVLLFGTGDMLNLKSDEFILLLKDDVLWRYCLAFGFAALAMTTVAALATFLSVFAENAIGPIVGTMGVVIIFTVVTNLDVPLFLAIKPYLFTTHMIGWKGFFSNPIAWSAISKSILVLSSYIVFFVGGAAYFFNRKDIHS